MVAEVPPPDDLSGGYFVFSYTNSIDLHRGRVHVYPFSPDGTDAYPYTAGSPFVSISGHEADVKTTVGAYLDIIKHLWNNTWTLRLDSLWRRTGTNVFTQQFPVPAVTARTGSGTTATTGIQRAGEAILNCRTVSGRRARFIAVGYGGAVPDVPAVINANAAGNDLEKWLDYVSKSTSGILAHDGSKPATPAHATYPYNRRLRRHYNMA